MKQPYNWDYTIRVKTKEGTFEYEEQDILKAVKKAEQYDYDELYLTHKKPKCDKCKIELKEVFIQETPQRTYRLCKNCNNYYMALIGNVKKLEKRIDNGRFKNKK